MAASADPFQKNVLRDFQRTTTRKKLRYQACTPRNQQSCVIAAIKSRSLEIAGAAPVPPAVDISSSSEHSMGPSARFFPLLFLFLLPSALAKKCPPGTIPSPSGSGCQPCPAGTFEELGDCLPCPPGTFNIYPGAQGVDVCERQSCPHNTFNPDKGASSPSACKPCPAGSKANPRQTSCVRCKAGEVVSIKFLSKGPVQKCDRCPRGYFASIPGGVFDPESSSFRCLSCDGRTNKKKGATTCKKCPPGTEPNNGKCVACKNGKVNDGSQLRCRFCPAGQFAAPSRDSCLPCQPGTFNPGRKSSCKRCPSGITATSQGATFCINDDAPCPLRYFRNKLGTCQTCSKNEMYSAASSSCQTCPPTEGSEGGLDDSCRPCPPDLIASEEGCICRPGYRTIPYTGTCEICEPGMWSKDGRNLECDYCETLDELSPPGATKCTLCPEKTKWDTKSRKCLPCMDGLVYYGTDTCVLPESNCEENETRTVVQEGKRRRLFTCSQVKCKPEEIRYFNKYSKDVSPRKVVRCRKVYPGEFSRRPPNVFAEDNPISECEKDNEVSPGGLNARCKKCPDGLLRDWQDPSKCGCMSIADRPNGLFGAFGWVGKRCEQCPEGTFGGLYYLSSPTCRPCPPGTVSTRLGSFGCTKCGVGTFSKKEGSSKCERCPAGTTNYFRGDTGCVPST